MDILALIEAHCRYVAAQVPRAAQGCRTALAVLLAVPSACARHLPDIAGSRTELFEALVRFGLLPALPSRHTQTGVLRLLGKLTPLVEARSERHWAMWLARVLDPASSVAERLAAGTPESQRVARDPGGVFNPMRPRDYARERAELQNAAASAIEARANAERAVNELRAALADAEETALALRTERDSQASRARDLESEREALRADLASMQERVKLLQREATTAQGGRGAAQRTADGLVGQLDQLRRDLAAVTAARDRAVDEAAAQRAELKTAQTRLDTANASLAEARERIDELEDDAPTADDVLETKLKEAMDERDNYGRRLTAAARERDLLRGELEGEATYRQAAVQQLAQSTKDLITTRGERDAAEEKIEVARDRLRRQAAEIAVRQARAPLSAELIAREVEALLSRTRE